MATGDGLSPEALENLRRLYCETATPVLAVAASAGLSHAALYRLADRLGWPRRTAAGSRRRRMEGADGKAPRRASRAKEKAVDRRAIALGLERFIAARLAAQEAGDGLEDPERAARTVAHLARGLSTVRTYLGGLDKDGDGTEHKDEPPARSLADLRDELRRHLERIREEERARRRDRRAVAEGDRGAPRALADRLPRGSAPAG